MSKINDQKHKPSSQKKRGSSQCSQNNVKLSTNKKQRKIAQIDMSCLTTAQKQICLQLLAQSDINFQEEKDGFSAELKIDPAKLTSQFYADKKTSQLKASPIKKRVPLSERNFSKKPESYKTKKVKQIPKIQDKKTVVKSANSKRQVQNLYNSCKKPLSKTVKVNMLTKLQELHPQVELYIYPKKMSFQVLIQLIEQIYQSYWKQQSILNQTQKNKTKRSEDATLQFCEWVFKKYIQSQKDKMKLQQTLVSLIETLNHYSYKHIGIQIFYNFLAGVYPTDSLHYFMVIRTLLQQLYSENILERISDYSSETGYVFRLKLNPYQKVIEQQKVYDFLEVCCYTGKSEQISKEDENVRKIFQEMTEHMFFDQMKKKNFINFHEMTQILLKEFHRIQTNCNTTNLELSFTNNHNSSLNEFIFNSPSLNLNEDFIDQMKKEEQNLQVSFEVVQQRSPKRIYNQEDDDSLNLSGYLPHDTIETEQSFKNLFIETINKKFKQIHYSLGLNEVSQRASELVLALMKSIVQGDKQNWLQEIRLYKQNTVLSNKVAEQNWEQKQLFFIENLQKQYQTMEEANLISNQFVKKVLTASYIRETIICETQNVL